MVGLEKSGVEEWAVKIIQAMYTNVRSWVYVTGQYSEGFCVGVGVHQGSVLSLLLFIIVLEALSREFRSGVPWELLYADDRAVMAHSLEECVTKLEAWKRGMESKGRRVNMTKTNLMVSGHWLDILRDSAAFPYAICRSGVGENSIYCSQCNLRVHKICSRPVTDVDGTLLYIEASFCYLGDMLCAWRGYTLAIAARCCTAKGKFKKLLSILTFKHLSLTTRGKAFDACLRSALLHESET
jgi:hypothetical protein